MSDAKPANRGPAPPAPLVPLPGRASRSAPLPAPLTSFVGREREVVAVARLLRRAEVRLLTLTGPGGVGKSRVALEVGRQAADDFADGVAFVPLAAVDDPALVAPTVAHALDVREAGDETVGDRLVAFLRARRLLLVLDNVEQVVEAAPVVAHLLAACPGVRVLATSRVPLRISGEQVYPVAPLHLPDPADPPERVADAEAVRLFTERARAADPTFALAPENARAVAAICQRLDGLPLAIELAAAKTRLLRPPALLARLDRRLPVLTGGARDQPARLRTMRDALAWSHDALAEEERALFRRLAVFVGGFDLAAAEAVANTAGDPGLGVLEGVGSLVDASLLHRVEGPDGEARFAMLETIREYALERQAAAGEGEGAGRAHARYFLALAEPANVPLPSTALAPWLHRLEADHDNLRAALEWAIAREPATAARLGAALWRFWGVRGHLSEGRRWLERVVAAGEDGLAPVVLAEVHHGAGSLALNQADEERAAAHFERALVLRRAAGDTPGVANTLRRLGTVVGRRGDHERGERLLEESLALYRAADDRRGIALALRNLGALVHARGDRHRGEAMLEEGLALSRAEGDRENVAYALNALGDISLARGDPARAAAYFGEGLGLFRDWGDRHGRAVGMAGVAGVAAARGRSAEAARLYGAAGSLRDAAGMELPPDARAGYERTVADLRVRLGDAAFADAWAAGRALPVDQAAAEAEALAAELAAELAADPVAAPAGLAAPAAAALPAGVSEREIEVLRLLAQGLTNAQIGERLFISPRTVNAHLTSIFRKLGVRSRSAATRFAVERGLT